MPINNKYSLMKYNDPEFMLTKYSSIIDMHKALGMNKTTICGFLLYMISSESYILFTTIIKQIIEKAPKIIVNSQ